MVSYIPPELTDIIIQSCISTPPSSSVRDPIDKHTRATLIACSLVCRDWLPASRSLAFSHISLKCTRRDLSSFKNLISSTCTFLGYVKEIIFIIPRGRGDYWDAVSSNLIAGVVTPLRPTSIRICGEEPSFGDKKAVLIRDHVRLALAEAFSKLYATPKVAVAPPTSLTISSLLFESFSNLTLFLRSFPSITSLRLHDLTFTLLHFHRICHPNNLRPPVRELVVKGISQSREALLLAHFVAADGGVIERLEVEFDEEGDTSWRWD
ncbi:hypothetical protein D9756_007096 [Leucocoprinus leucothites]|uniref:F-box domain-containing protein n=1 Tax=Leucocoprinus leucothites TaxID=201217 RepID=A0A8H5D730_9AGAR|nr:hypothetical protein D9756_007096 [Leucoagaricus leucothites]